MDKNKVILGSLAMDLKRAALGYYGKSTKMAGVFLGEAMKRKKEIDLVAVKPYIKNLLDKLDNIKMEKNKRKAAEDILMYSILFQNAALN